MCRSRTVSRGTPSPPARAPPLTPAPADRAGAGEDHDADAGVVADVAERADHLRHGPRLERVVDLGAVHRDAGDALRAGLVEDVLATGAAVPGGRIGGGSRLTTRLLPPA